MSSVSQVANYWVKFAGYHFLGRKIGTDYVIEHTHTFRTQPLHRIRGRGRALNVWFMSYSRLKIGQLSKLFQNMGTACRTRELPQNTELPTEHVNCKKAVGNRRLAFGRNRRLCRVLLASLRKIKQFFWASAPREAVMIIRTKVCTVQSMYSFYSWIFRPFSTIDSYEPTVEQNSWNIFCPTPSSGLNPNFWVAYPR